MEPSGRERRQMGVTPLFLEARNFLQTEPFCCHHLHSGAHGKEGVFGSSPEECSSIVRGGGAPPRPLPGRGRARRAGRSCGTRGRRAPRRGARRFRLRRRAPPRPPPRRPCARTLPAPSSSRRATYEPSGRSLRALGDAPPEPGREARERAGVADGAGRPDAEQDRVAVAVVAELDDGERVARGLALVPELAGASGSRTRPRRSRVCGGAPPRPSRRASGTRPSSASWTIAGGQVRIGHPASFSSRFSSGSRSGALVDDRGDECRLGAGLEGLGQVAAPCRRRRRRSPAP